MKIPPTDEIVAQVGEAMRQIRPLLAGLDPVVRGLLLAEAAGAWVKNHDEQIQSIVLELYLDTVRGVVNSSEEEFPPICDSCKYSVINKINFELRCNSTQSVFYGCVVEPEHSCDQWKAS